MLEAYPDQARVVYKQFPLSFHRNARPASEAVLFARKHGKFQEMHELLFKNYRQLSMENLKSFARELGLDEAALEASVTNQEFKSEIEKDMQDGRSASVSGTPTMFVNGKRVAQRNFAGMKKMIDGILAKEATAGSGK